MKLHDAAAILDVTEEYVKSLVRKGILKGYRYHRRNGVKMIYLSCRGFSTFPLAFGPKGQWFVDGREVRKRRKRLTLK